MLKTLLSFQGNRRPQGPAGPRFRMAGPVARLGRFVTLLMLLLGAFGVRGQTVTIGSTTVPAVAPATSTFYKGPIYRSSAGSAFNYSRFAYIYTAAELSAAGISPGALITNLGWLKADAATVTGSNNFFEVRLGNTSLSSIVDGTAWGTLKTGTTITYTSSTQNVTGAAGTYFAVANTTAFTYTGGNLLVMNDWVKSGTATAAVNFITNDAPNLGAGTASSAALTDASAVTTNNSSTSYGSRRPTLQLIATPPPACTAPPTAGSAVASVANGCSPLAVALSLSGSSTGTGLTYQWQQSTTGPAGTFTNISGATSNSYSTTLTTTTTFQAVVTCSGQSATSTPVTVTVFGAPSYAALPFTEDFETWISRCGNAEAPGNNWKNTPLTGDNSWRRDDQGTTAAWRFLPNGDFSPVFTTGAHSARFHTYGANTGTQGLLDLYANVSGGTGTPTLSFDYINPTGADKLEVLLSTDGGLTFGPPLFTQVVSAAWTRYNVPLTGATATSVIRLRATSDFGNDDLGVDALRVAYVSCPVVTSLSTTNVTLTSADVTFTAATGATNYTVTYTAAGGSPVTVSPTPTASPIALTGLMSGTTYTVSVVTNCGGGSTSAANSTSFTTLFPAPANDLCSGAIALACGQTVTGTTNGATTTGSPTGTCTATTVRAAPGVFYAFMGTGDIVTASTCSGPTATTGDTQLFVYSGTCGTFTCVGGNDDAAGCGTNGAASTVTFPSVAGTQYYLFVQAYNGTVDFGLSLTCVAPPSCPPVTALTAGSITATSASLSFTAGTGNTSYTVTYTPSGGATTTVTPAPTASPVALTGLTPNTTYAVSVTGNCSASSTTSTAATTSFTTLFPTPANDLCSGAIALACGQTVTGTTNGATTTGDPTASCSSNTPSASAGVFYAFTGTGDIVTVSTCGAATAIDTKLFVYAGACGTLTCVGSNDDDGSCANTLASTVTFPSTAGTTYYFMVQRFGAGNTGAFSLSLTCAAPPCNAPTALATNTITTTSANVTFTASASATSYVVTYTPAGGTATTVSPNPTASPVALTGLTPATAYTVSIVSNCAAGATSSPVTTTFTTATPAPQNLTVTSGQNVTATGPYNNITVQNGGTLTLSGATSATGAVQVQAGGLLITNCQALTGSGSFALQTGAELRICDPAGIAATGATGAIQLAGTRTFASDASYTYNGTAAQVTGSGLPASVRNLTVNNATGLTLSQGVSIGQVARLQSGNLATGGQSFTLLSSATGTALVDNTGGVVTGTGTMQRAVTNAVTGPAYRHFSSPVASTTLADLNTAGFSPTFNPAYNSSATPSLVTPFPTVFGYDQNRVGTVTSTYGPFDKGWFSPASASDVMQPTRGYTVNAPATATPIDFVGTFNNAAQNSGSLGRGTDAQAGWQLLGNPYPSPLDWSTVTTAQRPGMDGAMYVYQSTGQYAGTYRTYDNGVGGSPLIVAGSGYFARVSTPSSTGSVNLTNINRITAFGAEPAFGRGTADTRPQLHLQLTGAGLTDDTFLYQEAGATAGVDAQYDAVKLANPAGLDLASLNGTTQLAINGLPLPGTADVVVPLALRVPQGGSFGFDVAGLTNFGTATVYLRDALTGTQQLLLPGTRYSFTLATATAGSGRFSVVFRAANVTATRAGLTAATVSVYPNPAHGHFTVLLPPLAGQYQVQATLLNVLGQVVLTRIIGLTAAGATADFSTQPLAKGVYMLRLQAENQVLSKSVVVE
ncbi:fibronectin type III domain-containing protein [Hymenobacter antarcticus]|uniref:Fibronectin type-III domain-containing protein n=1 Tax=Hymenobacter antarcticus TaxID=486270 RepID=A0ABP7R3P2_9BACT